MTKVDYDTENELRKWLGGAKRVVIAGIGNPIRMDDFVGVKIVQDLKGKVSDKVLLIECETVPESFMQQIIEFNPTHVLLSDAAILGLKPGESRIVEPKKLVDFSAFSTHMLPLRIFCDCVSQAIEVKIALLLVEPGKTDFGEGLTPDVEASARRVEAILSRLLR